MKLTQHQINFSLDVFNGENPAESYFVHYKVKSMSVAAASATRLLKNVNVSAYLQELRQKTEDASVADVLERKQVLTN